jgi:hypothetical protein
MTTTVKAPRKGLTLGLPKSSKGTSPAAPTAPRTTKSGSVSDVLAIGGQPRVHLLPPQVIARKKAKALRRRLGLGVLGVVVLVAAGAGLATVAMISSQSALLEAQSQTSSLLQQQAKYGDVLKVKSDSALIQSSQKLATVQEIAWQPYISDIEKTLPAGASITTLSASIDAPFQPPVASTVPLQGPRIATVNVTLAMPQGSIASWLDTLPSLKGFVDATPNSVAIGADGGAYAVSVTIHINSDALANRFTKATGATK